MADPLPFTVETAVATLAVTVQHDAVTHIELNARAAGEPQTPFERRVARELTEYGAGKRRTFTIPIAPRGTEFERRVWDAVAAIPYGSTASYGEVARRVGRPRAYRAVGAANGRNPIPIVIPCHRVVASDGGLGGYGGGLPLKRRLLTLETTHRRRSTGSATLLSVTVAAALMAAAACADPARPRFDHLGPDTAGPMIEFTAPAPDDSLVNGGTDLLVDIVVRDRSSVTSVAAGVLGAFAIGYESVFPEDTVAWLTYRVPVPDTASGQFTVAIVAYDSLRNRTRSDRSFTIR